MKWIKIQLTKKEKEKIKAYKPYKKLRTFVISLQNDKEYLDQFINDHIKNRIELPQTEDNVKFTLEEDLDIFFNKLVKQHNISKTDFIRYYIGTLKEKTEDNSGKANHINITTLIDKRSKESLTERASSLGVSLNYLIEELFEDYEYKKINTRRLKNNQKITLNCNQAFKERFTRKAERNGISASLLLRTFLHHIKNLEEIRL